MPALDIQMLAYGFDILHQGLRGIVLRFTCWLAASATTLVEQNNMVMRRVKKTSLCRIAAATRAAMQKDYWNA